MYIYIYIYVYTHTYNISDPHVDQAAWLREMGGPGMQHCPDGFYRPADVHICIVYIYIYIYIHMYIIYIYIYIYVYHIYIYVLYIYIYIYIYTTNLSFIQRPWPRSPGKGDGLESIGATQGEPTPRS